MRISDWSADVCSSDRPGLVEPEEAAVRYGDPVGVAREVSEHHLGPGERRLGIDDPALLADRREVPQESAPFGEMREAAKESELAVIVQRAQPGQEQASEQGRSEERRVGTRCVGTCRSRWSP